MLIGPEDDYYVHLPNVSSTIFYGRFGGLSVLRSLGRSLLWEVQPSPTSSSPGRELVEAFHDLTLGPHKLSGESYRRVATCLPSKDQVRADISLACRTALICHDCLDHALLSRQLDNLYDTDPEDYSNAQQQSLALVYSLVALGRRYSTTPSGIESHQATDATNPKGFTYFQSSRRMVQSADFYTLDSLRAIVYHARYLLSVSMISKAHSCLATGLSAAFCMGMHISNPRPEDVPVDEALQRRRVFAVMDMMDTYLASLLGLPKVVRSETDVKPTPSILEEEEEDDDDDEDEVLPDLGGDGFPLRHPAESIAETVLCQKLNGILARIGNSRLLSATSRNDDTSQKYTERDDVVAMHEAEIQDWYDRLPAVMEETSEPEPGALRAQLMLRLWHAVAQIILYRPFLHHLGRDGQDSRFDLRGYEYGSACIRSAMQAIYLCEVLQNNGMLHEPFYLVLYSLAYATNILAFFIASPSPKKATVRESVVAVWKARDMLDRLGRHNNPSARRYTALLTGLLAHMPSLQQE
ncbi:hypothetical protein, variant 2 [Exophiala oligosperma]|nr:hypothetical protein, variant 1 [Exophiala oligosperma]XP_016262897.1 hypothetical protein, variant 2 [Exophiala oligosperma]KIW42680.1 hypothetical protein, variant 1 [Exophiala oligosperma]KIW42681.1 hypothetical protein, variant 2 [Exophiala oligosperma]